MTKRDEELMRKAAVLYVADQELNALTISSCECEVDFCAGWQAARLAQIPPGYVAVLVTEEDAALFGSNCRLTHSERSALEYRVRVACKEAQA